MEMQRCPRPSSDQGPDTGSRRRSNKAAWALALLAAVGAMVAEPAAAQASRSPAVVNNAAASHPTRAFWLDQRSTPAAVAPSGAKPAVQPLRFRAATLDRLSLAGLAAGAPLERSAAARQSPLVISLPHPDGGFQRFTLVDSPVMEPGLAAKHPDIKTYAGKGIDDSTASLRLSLTPLGLQASVRSTKGSWYIDPYYQLDDSLYVSYHRRDLRNPGAPLVEPTMAEAQVSSARGFYRADEQVQVRGAGFKAGSLVAVTVRNLATDVAPRQLTHATANADGSLVLSFKADPYKATGTYSVTASDGRTTAITSYQVVADGATPLAASGPLLRTYRLALLTDPAYATYFGGPGNVTAAKVALVNRVTQVYEDETSIRLVLIAGNDALNLNTAAQFSGANGPCGGTACFATASVTCTGTTLTRTRIVIGLLAGASNFDIGHIAVGAGGGGVASLGVVGGSNKAQGCTGLPTPVGDLFAVDYVAHEMGHQFAGNHTFNGTVSSCSGGNRSAGNSVEPGSGSSVMAYAGICSTDNLQPHSDPYWSQRSFDEVVAYTSGGESALSEIQQGALSGFITDGQQFRLRYNGNDSAAIVRGVNFTAAGVKAAVEAIAGWPAGATVTISSLGDTAFTISFGGTLAGINASNLQLVNCSGGCTGYVGEITAGGPTARGGTVTATGNSAPLVSLPATAYTIPVRTPFALTGSATDADADTLTYMWEQTDRGAAAGTALMSNTKLNGPLFRQFGVQALVTSANSLLYNSPGENSVTTNPTRVFPDLPQLLLNNTNAETGVCPTASAPPTAAQIDCFSEYLPTAAYTGFIDVNAEPSLNFKLTARDGRGGVNSAVTKLTLAPTAGPFLVTAPNTAITLNAGTTQTVSWSVANTNLAPVNTANVRISLSVDGGLTYPHILAASTPNDGSEVVMVPAITSATARIKVEAVGNVFFDISNVDFRLRVVGDTNGDGNFDCQDLLIVRASLDKRVGEPGFDPRADVNDDGVVDIRDLSIVGQRLNLSTRCG